VLSTVNFPFQAPTRIPPARERFNDPGAAVSPAIPGIITHLMAGGLRGAAYSAYGGEHLVIPRRLDLKPSKWLALTACYQGSVKGQRRWLSAATRDFTGVLFVLDCHLP